MRGGEVDRGLSGRVIAPGDYGVEVGDEILRKTRGEGFATELGGEAGGEVLKHNEAYEEAVARGPGSGLIAEEAELEREVGALEVHGGVDAGGVALEEAELIGRKGSDGAVGGCANQEGALETGADVFLTKPCLPEELEGQVRKLFDVSRRKPTRVGF